MDSKKMLMSAVAAIATSKIAKTVADLDFSDVLGAVGLQRRRNHALENIGLIALGAVAGAGGARLWAPATGVETGRKVGREFQRLGTAAGEMASEVAAEVRAEAPALLQRLGHEARNNETSRHS